MITPQDHPDFVGGWIWNELEIRWIENRIAQVIAAEREACAEIADHYHVPMLDTVADIIAAKIRARGKQ
jgi:hypothetical protein